MNPLYRIYTKTNRHVMDLLVNIGIVLGIITFLLGLLAYSFSLLSLADFILDIIAAIFWSGITILLCIEMWYKSHPRK